MPVEVDGRLIDDTMILLDQPLRRGKGRAVVRLKKQPGKTAKFNAPEEYALKLAEPDLVNSTGGYLRNRGRISVS
ncbi:MULTISPECIES: hypothetical protein [unclassified Methanoculleus]|jgi:hypothetical protein|uniref:hypothetical protein n=1 Tax=unclassified Methanoculleus TaxID=2619537 RepID=UPI0025EEC7B9|nr:MULTISPECIES: hypothetical protein [unclassified Methanoculleus]MCK9317027.1 hypothetical protein [Methanoculleus sp.]MDD2252902.1 hypothetical protein [Methanoculleus sp.]MDD2787618.1 hypothetical protein [Methanoculleus sp.]MDD3215681.1 hypothetical protein [Methanoculleus sp.]MDD4313560.1 hypothetical protein [Methanoculleus sp.]